MQISFVRSFSWTLHVRLLNLFIYFESFSFSKIVLHLLCVKVKFLYLTHHRNNHFFPPKWPSSWISLTGTSFFTSFFTFALLSLVPTPNFLIPRHFSFILIAHKLSILTLWKDASKPDKSFFLDTALAPKLISIV